MQAVLIILGFVLGAAIMAMSVSIVDGEFRSGALANAGAPMLFFAGLIGAGLGFAASLFLPRNRD